jgi:hypothetical protein
MKQHRSIKGTSKIGTARQCRLDSKPSQAAQCIGVPAGALADNAILAPGRVANASGDLHGGVADRPVTIREFGC